MQIIFQYNYIYIFHHYWCCYLILNCCFFPLFSTFLISLILKCKRTSSSILFTSRTLLTAHSEKPAASAVSFITLMEPVDFCYLLCQSKFSCALQIILLKVLLTRFPLALSILIQVQAYKRNNTFTNFPAKTCRYTRGKCMLTWETTNT